MGNHPTKQHGKIRSSNSKKNVHWKTAEPPFPPGKPQLVPGTPSNLPDVVTIRWERPFSDGGSPITGYLVEHRRTGSPHWVRSSLTLVQTNELSLSGLEPGWRYQFRVIAENYLGKSEPSELSDPLTVTLQRTGISPPRFTIELQDTVALENEKVEFRVHVIGEPAPQISWFKDGFEIFSSRRTKIVTENDSSILIIHQSALTDEGEIKCTATNRAGYAITRANLAIEALPKIRLPRRYEDGLIIEADEVVRLKVSIAGRPVPTIIWSHNGDIINNNERYELETTDKFAALKITNSQRSDRGEYNLRAINKLGEDNTSFLVTITSRPRPPGKVSINMSLGKTVTLSWLPPDDDGGCKIGNYIVEYYRIGWNVWLKAATCRQLSTILNDLIEGSEYKFRVKAENPYGLSDPSNESEVLFIPDPKRGIMKPADPEKLVPRKTNFDNPSPSQLSVHEDLEQLTPERSPDARNKKQQKLTFNIKFIPEIFDTNALEREMSYGSPQSFDKFTELPNFDSLIPAKEVVNEAIQEPVKEPVVNGSAKPGTAIGTFKKSDVPSSRHLTIHKNKEQQEPLHSSSEYMLVLYPEKEGKSLNENARYDMDLEDMMAPPPLSLSAPELNMSPPPEPIMRPAVSSTELLYERAMARFYQAVAFEESEKLRKRSFSVEASTARKRSISVDQQNQLEIPGAPRIRLNSLTETDRRSTLRRRLSGEYAPLQPKSLLFKQNSKEMDEHSDVETKPTQPETIEELLEKTPSPPPKSHEEDLSDDYTDSTVSSMESLNKRMMENEKRHARFTDEHNEMDTYHPPRVTLSPPPTYSPPDNSQAAEILTKKYPLPDPNFVPKPILKRPSIEVSKEEAEKSERSGFLQLFDRKRKSKSPSPSPPIPSMTSVEFPKAKSPELPPPVVQLESSKPVVVEEKPIIVEKKPMVVETKKPESSKTKAVMSREHSLEENHAMADFYAGIVQDVSFKKVIKRKTPLYLNPEEMRKAEEKLEMEESNESLQRTMSPVSMFRQNQVRSPQPAVVVKRPIEVVAPKKEQLNEIEPAASLFVTKEQRVVTEEEFLARLRGQGSVTPSPRPPPMAAPKEVVEEKQPAPVEVSERGRATGPATQKSGQTTPRNRSQSGVRTRSGSAVRQKVAEDGSAPQPRPTRNLSKTRNRSESKSPSTLKRRQLQPSVPPPRVLPPSTKPAVEDVRPVTPAELAEVADLNVKSTISYATDLSLFVVACYLYIFKDARLAIPILFLMIYRQVGDAVKDRIPEWMKGKKS